MDIPRETKVVTEVEQTIELLKSLGSKDFWFMYDPTKPEGMKWWGVVPDLDACVPVAGTHPGKPTAYGFSGLDIYLKIRACLPPAKKSH